MVKIKRFFKVFTFQRYFLWVRVIDNCVTVLWIKMNIIFVYIFLTNLDFSLSFFGHFTEDIEMVQILWTSLQDIKKEIINCNIYLYHYHLVFFCSFYLCCIVCRKRYICCWGKHLIHHCQGLAILRWQSHTTNCISF